MQSVATLKGARWFWRLKKKRLGILLIWYRSAGILWIGAFRPVRLLIYLLLKEVRIFLAWKCNHKWKLECCPACPTAPAHRPLMSTWGHHRKECGVVSDCEDMGTCLPSWITKHNCTLPTTMPPFPFSSVPRPVREPSWALLDVFPVQAESGGKVCAFGYVSTSLHILYAWSSKLKEKVATTCWIPTVILRLSEVDGHKRYPNNPIRRDAYVSTTIQQESFPVSVQNAMKFEAPFFWAQESEHPFTPRFPGFPTQFEPKFKRFYRRWILKNSQEIRQFPRIPLRK